MPGRATGRPISYDLGGHYRKFTATAGLGVGDRESRRDQVHARHHGRRRSRVRARDLDVQTSVPVDLDLTGHQQLALTFTAVDPTAPTCTKVVSALGHPQLLSAAHG